jgi:hypothetical protein
MQPLSRISGKSALRWFPTTESSPAFVSTKRNSGTVGVPGEYRYSEFCDYMKQNGSEDSVHDGLRYACP